MCRDVTFPPRGNHSLWADTVSVNSSSLDDEFQMTMSLRTFSYLRTLRRSWGLTQREMARLIGADSPSTVSRIERGRREPSLAILIRYQLLFGRTTKMLFPHSYGEEEDRLSEIVTVMLTERSDTSRRAARVRECLSQIQARLVIRSPEYPA